MSAIHEHAEDIIVLFSALGRPHPEHHDDPQVEAAAVDMLRILGHQPDQQAA